MDNLITDLVEKFDRGTLSRRHLIQGLPARAAAGGALPAAAQQTPFKSSRIDHISVQTTNLARSIEFYTKVLGARVAWRNDDSRNPLMKLYIGDFGLSIIKWPPEEPRIVIPHALHWSYRVDPAKAEETVDYIRSCGIEIEGPVSHKREKGILNWFFLDPDNYRVEVEARFTDLKAAEEVMERGKVNRREDMGLYAGDKVLRKLG